MTKKEFKKLSLNDLDKKLSEKEKNTEKNFSDYVLENDNGEYIFYLKQYCKKMYSKLRKG